MLPIFAICCQNLPFIDKSCHELPFVAKGCHLLLKLPFVARSCQTCQSNFCTQEVDRTMNYTNAIKALLFFAFSYYLVMILHTKWFTVNNGYIDMAIWRRDMRPNKLVSHVICTLKNLGIENCQYIFIGLWTNWIQYQFYYAIIFRYLFMSPTFFAY